MRARHTEILDAYKVNATQMNELFGVDLPIPKSIFPKVPVLIFEDPGIAPHVNPHSNDEWIDLALNENLKTGRRIWNSGGDYDVLLIDGREMFYNPEKMMRNFGRVLNEIS